MQLVRAVLFTIGCVCLTAWADVKPAPLKKVRYYDVTYHVKFLPKQEAARVEIVIKNSRLVKRLDFNLNKAPILDVKATGVFEQKNGRGIWLPPKKNARLSYTVNITHERRKGVFDALYTKDWTIFRGDDLVPPVRSVVRKGALSQTKLIMKLPKAWDSVNTGWPRDESVLRERGSATYIVDNPKTQFDRPIGWMIAGKLGTRREMLGNSFVSVSSPEGSNIHRMDVLTFVSLLWPQFEAAFLTLPPKILLVGAGDPFFKGGLSAPNSLFLHDERPLVSENATSTFVHEMVHVITGIVGVKNQDWIAEGVAEFYAVDILFRAGAITESRRQKVKNALRIWSSKVMTLYGPSSKGPVTAKAALFFWDLDEEIKQVTNGKASIDDLVRLLMRHDKASLILIENGFYSITKKKSKVIEQWGKWLQDTSPAARSKPSIVSNP